MRPYTRLPGVAVGPLGERMIAFMEKYCPYINEAYVTSAYRPTESGSHHSGLTYGGSPTAAVDFGAYDDPEPNDKDQRDMGVIADWLMTHFWDLTVELIHTQPHNDHYTYVRNQQRVGEYAASDHVNHIHWATSAALMNLVEARARSLWGDGGGAPTPSPSAECFGWDASNHDWGRGPMDLQAARADGISFFTHKAAEGANGWYVDQHYKQALDRARHAGIPVLGAYFVLHGESGAAGAGSPEQQAEAFYNQVNTLTPWWRTVPWIWQLDAERFKEYMDRAPNVHESNRFMDRLHQLAGGYGYFVGYAPRWLYGDTFTGFKYDLWASDYTGSGAARPYRQQWADVVRSDNPEFSPYSGKSPTILQFSSDAEIGSQPRCDINIFRGSTTDLINLASGEEGSGPLAINDVDFNALIWRVEAILFNRDATAGGPTQGEPNLLAQKLNSLNCNCEPGNVDVAALATAVAEELARRLEA